jgi:hypothetical protein
MNIINETSTQIDLKNYFESLGHNILSEHQKPSYQVSLDYVNLVENKSVTINPLNLNNLTLNETATLILTLTSL